MPMSNIIVCAGCGQPVAQENFKQQEWKEGEIVLDVKDFAIAHVELIGYCPLCAAINVLQKSLQLTTATEPSNE
jgi:hypothetical protein